MEASRTKDPGGLPHPFPSGAVLRNEIIPGTAEFRRALEDALRAEGTRQGVGPTRVLDERAASRNTIIYRCAWGSDRVIAKAQITKPPSVVVAEYHMLRTLEGALGPVAGVRALQPVTVFEELGVLVTKEEGGESLRSILEAACRKPTSPSWPRAVLGLKAAAHALRSFHDALPAGPDPGARPRPHVRRYLDFSPKNVLIQSDMDTGSRPEVVLMDPPEEERWGPRTEDIGGFCFDMTRTRFLPGLVVRPSVPRTLDAFKAWFLRSYFQGPEDGGDADDVREIQAAERRRASQALAWYLAPPWKYPSPAKEVLRLCYLGPLTAAYRARGLARSYRALSAFLREDDSWWERFERAPWTGPC